MTNTCRRILTCAVALSLVVHLFVAAFVRPIRSVDAHPEQTPSSIRIVVIHTPPPPTPPPKVRKAVTRPAKRSTAHPRPLPPRETARADSSGPTKETTVVYPSDGGGDTGAATPAPTDEPGPSPTPKPACSLPSVPASTIDAVSPTIPESLGPDVNAQAQVRVTLQPSGSVDHVEIYRSAGNSLLDREALRAARQSTYRAEVRDCVPIRGEYLFTVDFTG